MTNNPANIRRCPINIARPHIVNMAHRPMKRDSMTAIVTNHTFRLAGSPRCVKDIKRVSCLDRNRRQFGCCIKRRIPFQITPHNKAGRKRLTLDNHAMVRFVTCRFDGTIKKRLIFDNTPGFMTARCADHHFWRAIINAFGKFGSGKATKYNRMNCTKPRTAKHGHHSLRDHWHIDDDAITFFHTKTGKHTGKFCRLLL